MAVFRLEDLSATAGAKLWTLTFDLPGEKVNKLNRQVMGELESLLNELHGLSEKQVIDALIVRSGKPGNFVAGADITMIQAAQGAVEAEALSRAGQKLLDRWEDLPFPTVMAVNGAALGGGCEWSLASSAIVMSDDSNARIGLPEVMLGIIPGMGGCVRLPRKVGLVTALEMILASKNLNGERAYKAGLAEAVLPKENFEQSVFAWVRANLSALKAGDRIAKKPKLAGTGGPLGVLMEKTPIGRAIMLKKARDGVLAKTKGNYPAPLEAIEVLSDTSGCFGSKLRGQDRQKAMEREARGFGRCADTEVSRNLIQVFFLTEGVKKSKGVSAESGVTARTVRSSAVLGAGVMGGGIAQLFADKNVPVRMKDLNSQALAIGIQAATKIWQKLVQTRRISQREALQKLNHISPVLDFSGFGNTDLVVEAILEKLDVKQKVFQELENHVRPDCVIVTNTSSLSVTAMQKVMKHPERFAGMHFFNPVHKMPLVEVIKGEQTSDEAVSTVFQFCKFVGKTPIVVKDVPGFLVNRLLLPYLNEATFLVADGAPVEELDAAILKFGMPMGPMELIDEVGIDVGDKVAHILYESYGARMAVSDLNSKVVTSGRLGRKNGKGFYIYEPGKPKRFDSTIYEVLGVKPKSGLISEQEMVDRCMLPMINEAARSLDENVVATPGEVDLGMIMGTGFPPFRGGLLRYADTLGAAELLERLKKYEARFGARFEPAPGIVRRAKSGQKFYS